MRSFARILVALVFVVVAAACSSGGASRRSTPTPPPAPAPVHAVQQDALKALARLTSGVVDVTGNVSQGIETVDFTIEYAGIGDRFAYRAQSTYHGQQADVRVIAVPPRGWSFENGTWQPLPSGISLDHFRAQQIWSAVPFPAATPMGTEQVAGVAATHYRYDGPVQMAFGELAGSLIASGDVTFTGNLNHVTVDYWVAQTGGYPVKAAYQASGDGTLSITAELSNINNPAIAINPP